MRPDKRRDPETPATLIPARPRLFVFGLALLALASVPALAQGGGAGLGEVTLFGDEEDEFMIQSATKTEIPLSEAPGAVTVIGRQQIRNSAARTIPELLRLVGGVNVRWNPMVQTLDMRSFGQNPFTSRVLLLIDGVPYNSWNKGGFPQHPGFDFFSLQNVKQIEILRGPGSALYGENAYWGVINIVTLSGKDLEGGRIELFAGDLETQTAGLSWGKSVGDDGEIFISTRYQNGQLPTAFWFEENDSETQASDVFVKGSYKGFEASLYRYEDEVEGFDEPIPLPFLPPGAAFSSIESIEQEVTIAALKYSHEWDNGVTFGGDISFAQRDGSHCAGCHAAPQHPDFRDTNEDHGDQLIGDFRVGFQMIPSHDILVGVEVREIDSGDHRHELLQPSSAAEVVTKYDKLAVYAQDQISLADGKVNLVLGARFDDSNDLFDSEFSPRFALTWDASDRWVLRGGWSQAFRFPNFSELYQDSWFINVASGPVVVPLSNFVPNPGLQPEQIETAELGVQFRIHSNLSAKLDLYHSELDDFIVLAIIEDGFQSQNHPETASITGSEFELRWSSEKVNAFFNWSYQDSERDGLATDTGGTPLELVYAPENKLNLAAYIGPFSGFRAGLEVTWREDFLGPSFWNGIVNGEPGVATVDGNTVVNARLSYDLPWQPSTAARPPRVSIYGKNLFDEEYIETLIGTDPRRPGSTIYGAFELWF